jgi:hypothetical protein
MSLNEAYREGVREFYRDDPEWVHLAHRALDVWHDGPAPNDGTVNQRVLWDLVFQSRRGSVAPTLEDAWMLIHAWAAFCTGNLFVAAVGELPRGPGPDSDEVGNNACLTALCDKFDVLFSAEFAGGPGDDDGTFSWSAPLSLVGEIDGKPVRATCPPATAPLEVGDTAAVTTMMHLNRERLLVRWPYGYRYVYVLAAPWGTTGQDDAWPLGFSVERAR